MTEQSPLLAIRQRVLDDIARWFSGVYVHTMAAPAQAAFAQRLAGTPIQSADALLQLFDQLFIQSKLDAPMRAQYIDAINAYVRDALQLPELPMSDDAAWRQRLTHMQTYGYTELPSLDAATVAAMREHFTRQAVWGPNDASRIPLTPAHHSNVARFPVDTIMTCPGLWALAGDPALLGLVQAYLGVMPTLNVLAAWWSLGSRTEARDAQLFHLDIDDVRFCKIFIYLTDVDTNGGPHVYMPGTHRADYVAAAQARSSDPAEFDRWYRLDLRKTDADTVRHFDALPIELTGAAGSCFLVDTRGIHKGKLPHGQDRLLCQLQFGATPMVHGSIDTVPVDAFGLREVVPPHLHQPPFNYINRLFLDAQHVAPIHYQFWQ